MDSQTYQIVARHCWRLAEALKTIDLAEARMAAADHGSIEECRLLSALAAVVPLLPERGQALPPPRVTVEALTSSIRNWQQDLADIIPSLPDTPAKREVQHVAGGMAQALLSIDRLPKAE